MKNLKYGKGYEMYPSDGGKESYLPEKINRKKYLK
jgi:hypothetical protein